MTAVITGIIPQFQDSNGFALTNGQLYAYVPGTTTAKTIYTNDTLTTIHTQPIVLNARGEPPSPLYTAFGDAYKFVLQDEFGATLYTADNVTTQGAVTQATVGAALWPTSTLENANGVTPTDVGEPGDIRRYGALVDGATDDSTAFQNAINSGHPVYVPEGTTIINSALTATATTTIRGAGIGKTIIDGTGVVSGNAVIEILGALTAIGDLGSDAAKFDTALTFAATPSLAAQDVGVIWNPIDSSYTGHRVDYRAGEMFEVREVSGTTLEMGGRLYADYVAADVNVYRMDAVQANVSDMTILAPEGAPNGLRLSFCKNSTISRVECIGSTVAAIRVDKSYDVELSACRGIRPTTATAGNDYGLSISNSQKIRVNGGEYLSRRHAIAVGGDSLTGSVVNREVIVSGANLTNFTTGGAADFHANVEYSSYEGCTINGSSASFGGNHNSFRNNHCFGGTQSAAIAVGECAGLDLLVEGNIFENNDSGNVNLGWGIDLSGGSTSFSAFSNAGGTFKFYNNTWINRTATPTSNHFARLRNQGYAGADKINLEFIGNTIRAGNTTSNTLAIDAPSGNEWDDIKIVGNMFTQGDITVSSGNDILVADNQILQPSTVAEDDGIFVNPGTVTNPVIVVRNNYIASATDDAIVISGSLATGENVIVQGNVINGAGGEGILVSSVATVHLLHNIVIAATGNEIAVNTITTMTAIGNNAAVNKTAVTTDIEFGSDGADLIMVGLPTGNPGAGKLWSNTNVVTVGT